MATSRRQGRERASSRERIIEAALHVLESEGAAALTIRRIATDVEYTAPVVYQHFAGKEALVLELVAHGHRLMLAEFRRAAEEPDIDRRLLRIAAEYVRFAGEHRHLFEVMNGTGVDADLRRQAAGPAVDMLTELLTAWADAHGVRPAGLEEASEIVWGTVYGIASLGYLGTVGNERAQRLAQHALRALLTGWQVKTDFGGTPDHSVPSAPAPR